MCSADRFAELALKRGLRTWPKGAGWPTEVRITKESKPVDLIELKADQSADTAAHAAARKLAKTQESELAEQTHKKDTTEAHSIPQSAPHLACVVCS